MKQTLRIVVPIVVLMGVIFGVTFFAQYSPQKDEEQVTTEPPLRFGSSARRWDPYSSSLQDQSFPGFYEVQADVSGPKKNAAAFWFENRNTKPVTIQLKGVSCGACSGGRVATIPTEVTRELLQLSAVSCLPQGLFSGFPLSIAGEAGNISPERLNWEGYDFKDNHKASYKVPAAADTDGWSPTWGILELQFSVGKVETKTLGAEFALQVDGTKQVGSARFDIMFEGVNPFELSQREIAVGEITDSSDSKKYEILVYSATRGPNAANGDLPMPSVRIDTTPGVTEAVPFVTADKPVRVSQAELAKFKATLEAKLGRPVRVEAVYRLNITVTPKVGEHRIDIGTLERDVWMSIPDSKEAQAVRVRGTVRGGVWLDDQREIDMGTYKNRDGFTQKYKLITENKDAVVEIVAGGEKPEFLKASVEKLPPGADRGAYELKVTVPKESESGRWSGEVVLVLKGANPQRIRIPVKGNGDR